MSNKSAASQADQLRPNPTTVAVKHPETIDYPLVDARPARFPVSVTVESFVRQIEIIGLVDQADD